MSAPTSNIRGTFRSPEGAVMANAVVTFVPLDTPRASGGDIVSSNPITVTLSAGGQFGFSGNTPFPFKLTEGSYRVVLTDRDVFNIIVPGDNATHELNDLVQGLNVSTPTLPISVSPSGLAQVLVSSPSVSISRNGPSVGDPVRFFVIGETQTSPGSVLQKLKSLFLSSRADHIVGINMNPPSGAAGTIDANIGQYFSDYIEGYSGAYGSYAGGGSFYYCLGNNDWVPGNVTAVTNFFSFPSPERYYSIVKGDVTLFVLDSSASDPSGNAVGSAQYNWFTSALAASTTQWNVVVFRDPISASSSPNVSTPAMNWNWSTLNVHAIICGGKRFYERIQLTTTLPVFICGGAFNTADTFGTPVTGSTVRYNSNPGALLMDVRPGTLVFRFVDYLGNVQDSYSLTAPPGNTVVAEVIPEEGSPLVINPVTGFLGLDRGLAFSQVPAGGFSSYQRTVEGRILWVTALPSDTEVRQNPWYRNCLLVLGQDPPSLWYWHKNQFAWKRWGFPEQGNTTYYPGGIAQLTPPTFVGYTYGSTPSVQYAVKVTTAASGASIWVAIDDDVFSVLTQADGLVFIPSDGRVHTVTAYVTKTGNRDSDFQTGEFIAP